MVYDGFYGFSGSYDLKKLEPYYLCKTQRGRIFDPGFCQKMKDFWTFFEVFLTLFG